MKKTKINDIKINSIIEKIELDYLEFVNSDLEQRKALLPVTGTKNIKALIWNFISTDKWKEEISYSDYSAILDIWFSRIENER